MGVHQGLAILDPGTYSERRIVVDWSFQEETEGECSERLLEIAQRVAQVVASTVGSSVHLFRKRLVFVNPAEVHICALELPRDFLGHKARLGCQGFLDKP
jgi:hypothetical protein